VAISCRAKLSFSRASLEGIVYYLEIGAPSACNSALL
jgi:hypothetical protein